MLRVSGFIGVIVVVYFLFSGRDLQCPGGAFLRPSSVSCFLSRWSGGRWAFSHGVGDHGLGDSFYEFGGHRADTQAAFADAVNVAAFFLTNSCTLSGPCPVSVSTSSDIRS